ncbi:two-component system sensor histidine kinase CreC [Acinetobacter portensis]|uniref:two-component system sensor histidine kinase CreC n=1 Tax=Acinetobacter portensis TaxID=1839785 RepID=UPI0013D2B644|nr:two-component system sensor histidine kinase CreC [Acinetobacter portensis]
MSIFIRIWFFFGLIILLGLWFISYTFNQQVKPNIRQVVEDTLAENANIIAMLVAEDVYDNKVANPEFDQKIQKALNRKLNAQIWQHNKKDISQQIYITNANGRIIYDSNHLVVGQDYSKWNDVYLTLRGKYGVRSTRSDPNKPESSTMYIAAPIFYEQKLIGIVSIGKPNSSVQPYIQRAEKQLSKQAVLVSLISLFLASLVAYWLKHSIDRVRKYAQNLAPVNEAPHFRSAKELNQVTTAVEMMREKLEDKAYVEHYVNTLTHELKSPLTAIQASAELLKDDLPLNDQQQFAQHIESQSKRLKNLIDRMLLLTRLENAKQNLDPQSFELTKLIHIVIDQQKSLIQQKDIQLIFKTSKEIYICADYFWIHQTLNNLIDNAIDFSKTSGVLAINIAEISSKDIQVQIFNEGEYIPDYALEHIFENYFSLPRPSTSQRSSGIGLSIVKNVIHQHSGTVHIQNIPENNIEFLEQHDAGVLASITLPKNFT